MAEKITLARPYARAVFDIARQAGKLPGWSEALNAAALVVQDDAASSVLRNPTVPEQRRVDLIVDICDRGTDGLWASEAGRNLLRLLAENGRLDVLPEIAARFDDLKASFENTVDVELISAVEMDASAASRFQQALETRLGRSVALNRSVDPALLGGAILRADDLVIDGSLKTRLEAMAQSLTI